MPANLTPDYINAEKEYKAAKTPEEKLVCLQRMLSVIPKHKGTDKLQADLKKRISQLKVTCEQRTRKKGPSYRIRPEGAGQIALVGPPNSGKSSILKALTHAEPEIADYPFTTREPIPGMAHYKDIQIQLVDLPPISKEHCETFVFDNIKGADGLLLVIDLSAADPVEDYEQVVEILESRRIVPVPPETLDFAVERPGDVAIRSILLLTKCDLDVDGELLTLIQEMIDTPLPLVVISAETKTGIEELPAKLFEMLHIIRVYSKQPGKSPDMEAPFTIPIGANVMDFAGVVHKDFAEHLKSARLWGSSKFDGQIVQRDHILQDGDILELSI
ncbi:MAG: TGS domain-containing protein [Candidatus Omnitrophota bacterium]|nr:MAG: TGS domain-containing protein [Candidatus Omnitrophota bacterium]